VEYFGTMAFIYFEGLKLMIFFELVHY